MSPPIFLPSTPRLEEILDKVRDAIALEEPSLLVKNGEDVVYRYSWPSELIVKVRDEIDNRRNDIKAAMKGIIVKARKKILIPVRQTSGDLYVGPDEMAIILPIICRKNLEQAVLETWEEKEDGEILSQTKTKLDIGLFLIHPSNHYRMPDKVPFIPCFCHITQAEPE